MKIILLHLLLLLLEIPGKEAGTVVVEIANGNREETDGGPPDDPDTRHEGPHVKKSSS